MSNTFTEIGNKFCQLVDCIDWSNIQSLRNIHDILQSKINYHEDSIPNEIEDDYFNQPQNIHLSFKLRLLNSLLRKIKKYIMELEEDSQDPQAYSSEEIRDYDPSTQD